MLLILAALVAQLPAAAPPPAPVTAAATAWPIREGEVTLTDFRFKSGEALPKLRMHYTTLGAPRRDGSGRIANAVLLLHGTGGSGKQFLQPQFADQLFGPGEPLDIARYFIVMPDNIGHGASSKPSDGLRMAFPKYDYDDMVEAQRQMLRGLGVAQLRLILGTSMGCMHIFAWGETHPDFARALMPLACQPVEIAGLNRLWRQLLIDGIKADPAWQGGKYTAQPQQGLRTAQSLLIVAGAAPLYFQAQYPTRDAAGAAAQDRVAKALPKLDANDMIYQFESSRNYNPWPRLEAITAPMMWVNSADDFINPRNFDFPQAAVRRMRNARFRLIPETADTRGHGTHTWAVNSKADLSELLARTE